MHQNLTKIVAYLHHKKLVRELLLMIYNECHIFNISLKQCSAYRSFPKCKSIHFDFLEKYMYISLTSSLIQFKLKLQKIELFLLF